MNEPYIFPKAKFVDENTLDEQFNYIRSEFIEAVRAEGMGERDEELADLWHSIETYFRIREKQGIAVSEVINHVKQKNGLRGYYENNGGDINVT